MASVVVVGAQWGDEGKGKVVDILSEFADLVVRFQGGANAGHTLVVDGTEVITHLVPSGVMYPNKRCAIGSGVVVDPDTLAAEIAELRGRGLLMDPRSLVISQRCQVVMPYHKMLDAARESARGESKIGTTLRGIGPCLEDRAARTGVRMVDLMDSKRLAERLDTRLAELNALFIHYGREPLRASDLMAQLREQAALLEPFVGDVGELVRSELDRGRAVLFEGAQGALLDVDHGTYPFVTSSNTVAGAACTGVGLGPNRIGSVIGVAKAYATRVGAGPFPTELTDDRGTKLRETGHEYGATTGRPRRCGWLDLAALRYAVSISGCTGLCLTKLDVLGGTGPLRVCVGYRVDGHQTGQFPADAAAVERLEPIYEELEGWDEQIDGLREIEALPAAVRRYLQRVESFLNIPVEIVSVGPARAQTIMLRNPFRRTD
jgi:adenylosuccinate synthase